MRNLVKMLVVPALAALAACSRGEQKPDVDAALQNDLSLAASAQPYQPQQFVSPQEQLMAQQAYGQPRMMNAAATYPVSQTSTVRRTTSSPTRTRTVYRSPAPAPEPIRHTRRDAAIGAATGAVIGVATSRDKVKGGIIGGVLGGVAGAVIGHTVDIQH